MPHLLKSTPRTGLPHTSLSHTRGAPLTRAQVEYRVWNPFRSKLAASILAGVDNIYVKPGSKLLYLGAASGTSVSHCSDLVSGG